LALSHASRITIAIDEMLRLSARAADSSARFIDAGILNEICLAATEAVYNSVGESDEFTESVNYEDDVCSALVLIPCATDAEFLEKLRWLFARDVANCGKPSFRREFGGTLVAIAQHFSIASREDACAIVGRVP
jgi:hypothetical protein